MILTVISDIFFSWRVSYERQFNKIPLVFVNIGKTRPRNILHFIFKWNYCTCLSFFLFKLEIETNLSNSEEKIIFEGFFDSRLKMKLPTQKKFQMEKVVQKFTRKTRSRLRAFLRARGLSLKAFQRWLNFFGSSFKSRFLCLCDYDVQQWRHQRGAMLRMQQLLANRRLANFFTTSLFFLQRRMCSK